MRVKKVNRYYCDHCKKGGCSAGHMKRHERGCTANPNRECGVCKNPTDLSSLKDFIRTQPVTREPYNEDFGSLGEESVKQLRDKVENCPACLLAALRQTKTFAANFRFKEELATWWKERNEEAHEREMTLCRYNQ